MPEMKKKPRRRAAPKTIRRPFFGPEKMRAAFLAGSGLSGGEIAEQLGGTTGAKVRAMLHKSGIRMTRRVGQHVPIRLDAHRRDQRALEAAAFARDLDPADLALELLRRVLAVPSLVDNLIDDGDDHAA
jgi:hypothetical protein